MTDPVLAAARRLLDRFSSPGLILVAISGGSDSKGLLLALRAALDKTSGFTLAACTVDHGLRQGSDAEARDVADFCAGLGVAHTIRSWTGEKPSAGLQAAAREARYAMLCEAAVDLDAICIVTAHTADDQAETIAMRKARSTERTVGLSGMADAVLYDRQVWIMRPFLSLRREAIRKYLRERGEGWFDDPSNANPAFERVRMRNLLSQEDDRQVPAAPSSGPSGQRRMARADRMAQLFAGVSVAGGLVARIEPTLVSHIEQPDVRDAIPLLAAVIGGVAHVPGHDAVDRVAAFLANGMPGRITTSRAVFDRRRDALYLYRENRGLAVSEIAPGETRIWDGRFLVRNKERSRIRLTPLAKPELGAVEARLIAAGVPPAIARRAAPAAMPSISQISGKGPTNVELERHIALYDTFLPRFDLTLANRLAALFGRNRYLAPPVHDVLTEMKGD
ncbi:tRNA(Ile)-lysidine synthase [Pararhizobium capsulatum DSM 1112]|uniref:tRNA(Ile)-lysidine synthase n=1 Tax=Pararhizobium capsulatum DSM 1112 TaxID=1121113 RepID=A0ABU0BU15_9HYPH|nr:tRNA lysidine(34) synthetase TilS [Pararhizobium capsulatum]MDQ0321761.1 tRNA(Ile)-lysidine synthase [Pararhizobium capsulatum DSM 1112]